MVFNTNRAIINNTIKGHDHIFYVGTHHLEERETVALSECAMQTVYDVMVFIHHIHVSIFTDNMCRFTFIT